MVLRTVTEHQKPYFEPITHQKPYFEPITLHYISETVIRTVVNNAKRLYKTKESRLQYVGLRLGKKHISDPDKMYEVYFTK